MFPEIKLSGCFFHLCQNIWKKVNSYGIKQLYISDSEIAMQAKMVASLAFVPIAMLERYADDLEKHLRPEVMELFKWFRRYYIGNRKLCKKANKV